MKRINTATKAVDLFGPGKHGFKPGNVLGGESPTKLSAEWFNAIQEEAANLVEQLFGAELDGEAVNQLATLFAAKFATLAPLHDAPLTGIPTAPTAAPGTDTNQIATMAAVKAALNDLVGAAPGVLDTLEEFAIALANDPNFAATLTASLALKAPLASPALTGDPTAPTQALGDDSTRLATTAFVAAALAAVYSPPFESAEIAFAPGASFRALAHGLGSRPMTVRSFLRCKTADLGYQVGDEVPVMISTGGTTSYNITAYAIDETYLGYIIGSGLHIHRLSDGAIVDNSANAARWRYFIRAWKV
ncbi:hypothetical protein [Parvibaculum sp.]|uniref:hypothetical protein n=1 Tax=Parvibaculum sp. TaxID=2024848 RepID=UPI00273282D0|nr:hypothetical protein [Parvibaculum sp.]MDP3329429.1 hypothetical protein [Parvibaculum sp.]